jgi:monofunctional glycosyltransferase
MNDGRLTRSARLRSQLLPCARLALVQGTRALVLAALAAIAAVSLGLLLLRFIDPPTSALMFTQSLYGQQIDNRWVPLARVSPNLVRAVILSEDNKFCSHFGIDMGEMRAALSKAGREGEDALRGASTISQQVAKNMALWPGRSALRKVLELGVTLPMEVLWPKARIMEIYLNIAEWGPGIFGAEAASQYHFSKPASRLTQKEAALLAVALPNPFDRVAGKPGQGTKRLASTIEGRMAAASGSSRFDCVLRSRK